MPVMSMITCNSSIQLLTLNSKTLKQEKKFAHLRSPRDIHINCWISYGYSVSLILSQ